MSCPLLPASRIPLPASCPPVPHLSVSPSELPLVLPRRRYVKDLETCMTVYHEPLHKEAKKKAGNWTIWSKPPLVTDTDVRTMFSSMKTIYELSVKLLSDLRAQVCGRPRGQATHGRTDRPINRPNDGPIERPTAVLLPTHLTPSLHPSPCFTSVLTPCRVPSTS